MKMKAINVHRKFDETSDSVFTKFDRGFIKRRVIRLFFFLEIPQQQASSAKKISENYSTQATFLTIFKSENTVVTKMENNFPSEYLPTRYAKKYVIFS